MSPPANRPAPWFPVRSKVSSKPKLHPGEVDVSVFTSDYTSAHVERTFVRTAALMGSMIVEVAWAKQIARARFDVLQSSVPRLVLCHDGRNSRHKEGSKHSHL